MEVEGREKLLAKIRTLCFWIFEEIDWIAPLDTASKGGWPFRRTKCDEWKYGVRWVQRVWDLFDTLYRSILWEGSSLQIPKRSRQISTWSLCSNSILFICRLGLCVPQLSHFLPEGIHCAGPFQFWVLNSLWSFWLGELGTVLLFLQGQGTQLYVELVCVKTPLQTGQESESQRNSCRSFKIIKTLMFKALTWNTDVLSTDRREVL